MNEVQVSRLEVLVEEPSMEQLLRAVFPRMLSRISYDVFTHQCKQDLLQRLPERLQGYSRWLTPDHKILVVLDRDGDDCVRLLADIDRVVTNASLVPRSKGSSQPFQVATRLAIEELEAWYFGDWEAVRSAYPRVPETIPAQARYRKPDVIKGGTWENFERVLQKAGYFQGGLRKIEAAKTIGPHMNPDRNTSPSFAALRRFCSSLSA